MSLVPASSRGISSSPVSSVFTRTGAVVAADGDYYGAVAAAKTGAVAASRYVGATVSGAPVAGTFAVGDFVVDQAGGVWTCITAGTPGTWGPAVAAGSVGNTHIAPGAAISASKLQGGANATSGGLYLLSTTTLGADGVFDVSGIDQSYSDLLLVLIARGTRAAASEGVVLNLNNDTGANYDYNGIEAFSGAATISPGNAQTNYFIGDAIPGSTGLANSFGVCEIRICGYTSTTWLKTIITQYGGDWTPATGKSAGVSSGFWLSTAAVNRVKLQGQITSALKAGSVLRIYGRP